VAAAHWSAAKLLQAGREVFRDNLKIFFEKSYWLIQTAFFKEKVMNYESQKCIIVAFHPRNAPIFNPGLLLWVPQTQGKRGDHVLRT